MEGSSSNPVEAQDLANSWRFADGERIDDSGISTYSENSNARAAVSGGNCNALWYSSNGSSSYTWKATPNDGGTVVNVPGAVAVGIDVSQWNGSIDWNQVKAAGVDFAIIRCGYGSNWTDQDDKTFLANVRGAKAAGIKFGVYLYSYATKTTGSDGSGASEGDHAVRLLQAAGLSPSDLALPVFLDMEDSSTVGVGNTQLANIAEAFCNRVSAAGYKVGIYASTSWWTSYLTDARFSNSGWHKWVASWVGTGKQTNSGSPNTEVWQFSNCCGVAGISGYVDMNFSFESWSGSSSSNQGGTAVQSGWQLKNGTWYYLDGSGNPRTGWLNLGGTWYYLDPDNGGAMKTGVYKVGSTWYASSSSGAMYSSGWVNLSGKWYYANSSGALATGWKSVGGVWYYMDSNAVMQTGWEKVGGTWYYMNGSGAMLTGWQWINGAWYYLYGSGAMATGWQWLGGAWYYLRDNGSMATGWELVDGATWYYMNGSGAMQTGWLYTGGAWYYLYGSGAMATGWQWLGGAWYYLRDSGAMATGWVLVGDAWYYMNGSGVMQTGWLYAGGAWYYLYGSGAMATGWQKVGGVWYYLNDSGAMLTGSHTIDGTAYRFSASGALIS